ncbi:histidine kinase-, DNA gyrase b-, and HSP90-like ATPase domain-containing protein [Hirsutella rhossiliensis]|uniref:histidine kinase n=1 Tax=Hirsutella rhossiliensis TaxID=111463 RepID=A0A9P8MRE7_9HYPO|nr:histidine kinase-, DNA gyrase b-, and HSP90-like ATPase domain-containing protein [Hirsutella rhossiliensis]KAH0960868.1 histidine kinase-, DNA gyrase b-, and HSP90-like ATPase domain-containing protein [Hirsutella rhossiliensis]
MDAVVLVPDHVLDPPPPPPPRLYERLRQIAGYTWDESKPPFHSTYDFWHVFGTRIVSPMCPTPSSHPNESLAGSLTRLQSGRPSPSENGNHAPFDDLPGRTSAPQHPPTPALSIISPEASCASEEPVVARISYHAVREERAFQIAKSVTATADPNGDHIVKPLDLIRLSPIPGDRGVIVVAIYAHPGHNLLYDVLDMGPAFYTARKEHDEYVSYHSKALGLRPPINLEYFLDFAIGAAQCLEILHHGQGMIHGEIRGDAFHFNAEENKVRIVSFGSGVRSFEHGLTSTGWSTLSREVGAKNKLLYISPEQTGRMPAEPDTRTDIYSLGVLLWTLLAQQPVHSGDSPLDIVQGVLGRRIPNVATVRMDIPDVIGRIIQKCTAKNVTERYHSASGLRYDLARVQQLLSDGDSSALRDMMIGTKDVSSFFMLPSSMIGRHGEMDSLIQVIDRASRSHAVHTKGAASRFPDGSSLANEAATADDMSSGASSVDGTNRRSGSFAHTTSSEPKLPRNSIHPSLFSDTKTLSNETISSCHSGAYSRLPRPWERHQSMSAETVSAADSTGYESARPGPAESSVGSSLPRQLGSAKFRRRGHCEIVTLEGAGGLGKSSLGLKQYVRPVWPMLHRALGLPEFLLGPPEPGSSKSTSAQSSGARCNGRSATKRRGSSSPGCSPAPSAPNPNMPQQSSQDYLCAGTATKTTRLMNTCLDILRVFTTHKFITFCLDDVHFADDESLELISQIIGAKMKMVIIMTYRPEELSRERMERIIYSSDADEIHRNNRPAVTRITLSPLSEDDILEYVSTLLSRPKEEVLPLALVIQSKTAGNPFYMREMLSACHRKKCIWYDYRDSQWHYDLDRLFAQFQGEKDYDVLDTGFITQRLSELPPAARAVLAWGALLGNSFSFELIARLMGGEFEYDDDLENCCEDIPRCPFSEREAIAGLQAAIQAYIVVPSETDDRFRFAHDRYIHASAALKECNARRMHFIISQTLLKYYGVESRQRDSTASHICEAVSIIRRRVPVRREFRKLLTECAQAATENGARPTAAKYYSAAIDLLQVTPWVDGAEDVTYEETMQLHLRSAECYLFMGQLPAANDLLSIIFANARTPIDKAPAYVLQSRIFAQNGNALAAFISLKECLAALGVSLGDEPTYEKCDEWFERLTTQIRQMDRSALSKPTKSSEAIIASIGAVLSETASAAWWSDCLHFYHLTLVMLEVHLSRGAFPQSGMAFLNLGVVALSRFNMTQFAVELGSICQDMLYQPGDAFTIARGQMMHACCIGHVQYSVALTVTQLEDVIEMASVGGDRMSTILSYGLCAQAKFFASENCADLEGFCHYGCEDIPNWSFDTRGGALLVAIRQTCRALQGKTQVHDAVGVLSDEQHDGLAYKSWLTSQTQESNRSSLFYEGMELVALFLFGHYERAVEIGRKCCELLSMLWSARNSRLILLFHGLARTGQLLRRMQDPRYQSEDFSAQTDEMVAELHRFVKMMVDWSAVSDVNYRSWSRLLEAQIAELSGEHGQAIQHYEEALDHAAEQDFVFEEALGNYLMAGFFIRRKARRSARAALQDAVGLYRQIAATGVAEAIENEHSLLLHGPTRNHRTVEVGIQTDFVGDASSVQYRPVNGEDADELRQFPTNAMSDLKGDRIGAWRGSMNMQTEDGAGLPALDMIDLHAILVSSQVISSVLQVEELLKTMCDVILQTCGGSATRAAIVVQETDADSWCVAASGNPERGASAHKPGLPLAGTSLIAENVVLYCTRFLESVFIPDLLADERFGNVNEAWLQRNPVGKAIIAIPICHGTKPLLGVLYLEGEPGSFTDRNVTVLQLLVNQIGISYSNALSMKNVEKISAENRSMVSVQKRALAKALEAEMKAKNAEAEAKRNVKLAEEAAKAKSIFLANVSHELRTPLNGVIGNSELLRDSNLNKEQLEMADSIRVSADLLLTVINDILDFSKMEADKMKLYIIAFNPEEMVREVVRAVSYSNREKTSKKNVKIVQDINLPPMLIFGDPIRLHQVLGNLIGNSLKFTEDGSITIGARLDSETSEKATLTFWVRDTGIGIPPQQLAKLFQPFSQADASTARKYGGSGLGLSICKSLIEIMMKGKIQLESEETVGTTAWFTVAFDKAKPDVSAGDAQSKSSPPIDRYSATTSASERAASPNPFLDLTRMCKEDVRICVAEDNPINQKIAIQYVQRLGYTSKAKEGKPYHIVLMDVQMPVLDGYEATKLLRKDSIEAVRKVLVIAMTASAIQGDREKCLAAGMNDYLAKPVRSEVLKRKLDAYVNNARPSLPEVAREPPSPLTIPGPVTNGPLIPSPKASPPAKVSITVSDSISGDANYNVPLDSPPLADNGPASSAQQSAPMAMPIRGELAHDGRLSCTNQAPNGSHAMAKPQKRQAFKGSKGRGNSETTTEKPPVDDGSPGMLTKKVPQQAPQTPSKTKPGQRQDAVTATQKSPTR